MAQTSGWIYGYGEEDWWNNASVASYFPLTAYFKNAKIVCLIISQIMREINKITVSPDNNENFLSIFAYVKCTFVLPFSLHP